MNVLLISPGFPAEMPLFTRGLAEVGARVYGIGDTPRGALDPEVARCLTDYLRIEGLWDEAQTVPAVQKWVDGGRVDRVECLWEPGMMLAARLREALSVPGLGVEATRAFRDKELMKQVLDEAGLRTPRHARAATTAEVREGRRTHRLPVDRGSRSTARAPRTPTGSRTPPSWTRRSSSSGT